MFSNNFQVVIRETSATCTNVLAHRFRISANIESRNFQRVRCRLEQAAKHANRSGFTRAVRPQKAEDLAFPHFKIDLATATKMPEPLDQVLDHDRLLFSGMRGSSRADRVAINLQSTAPTC